MCVCVRVCQRSSEFLFNRMKSALEGEASKKLLEEEDEEMKKKKRK